MVGNFPTDDDDVIMFVRIRSAQFGVYNNCLDILRDKQGRIEQSDRILGTFDYQVILAGFAGGIGRGLVEGPFEFVKVRRQVGQSWKWGELLQGSQATIFRNSILFCSFMIYIDMSKQIVPGEVNHCWPNDIMSSQSMHV